MRGNSLRLPGDGRRRQFVSFARTRRTRAHARRDGENRRGDGARRTTTIIHVPRRTRAHTKTTHLSRRKTINYSQPRDEHGTVRRRRRSFVRSSDVPPRSVTVRRTPLNSRFCFCFCFFLFGLVSWSFYSRAGSVSPSSRVRVFPSRRGGPAPRRQRTRNRRWETDPRPMRQHDREEKATAYGVLDSSASVGGEIFQNRKTVCNPARRIRRKRGLNEKRRRVQTVFSHAEFYSPPLSHGTKSRLRSRRKDIKPRVTDVLRLTNGRTSGDMSFTPSERSRRLETDRCFPIYFILHTFVEDFPKFHTFN